MTERFSLAKIGAFQYIFDYFLFALIQIILGDGFWVLYALIWFI